MAMRRAYNVVDADGHILEPLNLWRDYIGPGFRERRPRFVIDDSGKERLTVEGKLLGNPRHRQSWFYRRSARRGHTRQSEIRRLLRTRGEQLAVLADYIGPHKIM